MVFSVSLKVFIEFIVFCVLPSMGHCVDTKAKTVRMDFHYFIGSSPNDFL